MPYKNDRDYIDNITINTKSFSNGGSILVARINVLKLATELKEKGYSPAIDVFVNISELKTPLVSKKSGQVYKTHYAYIYNPDKAGNEATDVSINDLLGDDSVANLGDEIPF